MNVIAALEKRKSVRTFLDKEVAQDKIDAILAAARHAPSGTNTQPWQVAVVTEETKQKLQAQLESKFRRGDTAEPDYRYYPEKWLEPYKSRRVACGLQMYSTLSVEREDKQRRLRLMGCKLSRF